MCPSMSSRDSYTTKQPKLSSEVSSNHANPSKFLHHFLYKATIVAIFLVILPLLPSQAPEFISQYLQYSRSWELLQLIFVGIAVSYGLFSRRNDETDHKEHSPKFDHAHSYFSRLLQVSSVFDDEAENASLPDDNKVQTWNSQYYREEPVVMVAEESPVHQRQNHVNGSQINEKPLLLPVRSLKSRVSEANEIERGGIQSASVSRTNSNLGSKLFAAGNSRKSRMINGEVSPENMEEKREENVVHRSPIPWRSRSGRMEMKEENENEDVRPSYSDLSPPPAKLESELNKPESRSSLRSQSFRSPKPNSTTALLPNKPSSPKNQSHLPYFPSESQGKSVEDVVMRRKIYNKSSTPLAPPPPPPPPPSFLHKSPPLVKSKTLLPNKKLNLPQKELKRSVRSVPNDFTSEAENEGDFLHRRANSGSELRPKIQGEVPALGKSVRSIRQREPSVSPQVKAWEFDEDITIEKRQSFKEFTKEDEKRFDESVFAETDDSETEDENDFPDGNLGSSGIEQPANDNAADDQGPDVDKKADEFIAKFREQIRLQRIQSIRRSAEQNARNHLR